MNARIGLNLQVTATQGCHSHYDWCFQTIWLLLGSPEDPEDNTVMEMHNTQSLNSAVESAIYSIRTEDHSTQ